jgi:glycine/D-amino acid oxidase-like deaminating enzyme/aspartate/methionine/tyrosine aminotransferase
VIESHLTRDELAIATVAEIDLAIGYPAFPDDEFLCTLVRDRTPREVAAEFREVFADDLPRGRRSIRQADLIAVTLRVAAELLDLPPDIASRGVITYSGSHALERVITTCLIGQAGTTAVTTEPCIDILPAMIGEANVAPSFVRAPSLDDVPSVEEILSAASANCSLGIISSPENPTGAVFDAEDLAALGDGFARLHVPLLVDQSFLRLAPGERAASFPSVAGPDGDWAFMWDTGKTFDVANEKLGFVFAGRELFPRIARRCEVLQATLPDYRLMLFSLLLRRAREARYCDTLSKRVGDNAAAVASMLRESAVRPTVAPAGGFLLIDVTDTPRCRSNRTTGAALAAAILEETGVGVVGAERFFYTRPPNQILLRLAIARPQSVVEEGVERLLQFLGDDSTMAADAQRGANAAPAARSAVAVAGASVDLAVIGGGITGAVTAVTAARSGHRVALLERQPALFSGASGAGFGSLTPFSDPFFRGAARDFAHRGTTLYRSDLLPWLRELTGVSVQFCDEGLLELVDSERDYQKAMALVSDLRENGYGDEVQMLDRDAALWLEPNLSPDFTHALKLNEPWLDTHQLFHALRAAIAHLDNLDLYLDAAVSAVESSDSCWRLRAGGAAPINARWVIVATGATTTFPNGIAQPIVHWVRGDAAEVQSPSGADLLRRHIYRGNGFVTPRSRGRLWLGATYDVELAAPTRAMDKRDQITVEQLELLIEHNRRIVPGIVGFEILRTWRGWRPASTDGLPIIGRSDHKGLAYATGCKGLGLTMAPAVGHDIVAAFESDEWSGLPTEFDPLREGSLQGVGA